MKRRRKLRPYFRHKCVYRGTPRYRYYVITVMLEYLVKHEIPDINGSSTTKANAGSAVFTDWVANGVPVDKAAWIVPNNCTPARI